MKFVQVKGEWYYDTNKTASILGVTPSMLCRWRALGHYPDIEYIKIDYKFYYSEVMVKKLKALRKRGVKPADYNGVPPQVKKYYTNDEGEAVEIGVKASV